MKHLAMAVGFCLIGSSAWGQTPESATVERCEAPFGAIAVNEPEAQQLGAMGQYGLKSPSELLRLMIQESNCFTVVERGSGMDALKQERDLLSSGQLQRNSNLGAGQMRAADFILTPSILFSQQDSGSTAKRSIGGLLGRIPTLNRNLKFQEAMTGLIVTDVRMGTQVASANGRATSSDLKNSAFGFQSAAFTASSEGKVVAESLRRNYNTVVARIRNNPALATARTDAPGVSHYGEGVIVSPKMDGLPLLGSPAETGASVASLRTSDRLFSLGEAQNGYLRVQRGTESGWVRQSFLMASDERTATAASGAPTATPPDGAIVRPKIDNVKLLSAPIDTASAVATLKRGDDLVYLGEERDGFVRVQGPTASGWVKLLLLTVVN